MADIECEKEEKRKGNVPRGKNAMTILARCDEED